MSLLTIGGVTAISATIRRPVRGVWLVEATLAQGATPSGRVELKTPGLTLSGSVVGGPFMDRSLVRLVAGGNGLAKSLAARGYSNVEARVILGDVLREAGEELSATVDAKLLAKKLPHWTRLGRTAGEEIGALATALGATYRFLDDGKLWLGVDTWPTLSFPHQTIDEWPDTSTALIASDEPTLRPGVTFNGRRVTWVEDCFTVKATRTTYGYANSLADSIRAIVVKLTSRFDYHGTYVYTVVTQHADGTVDVVPYKSIHDPPKKLDTGKHVRVPIRTIRGIKVEVDAGTRVALIFENGSPSRPVVELFEAGDAKSITLKATTKVVVDAPSVELAGEGGRGIARIGDLVQVSFMPLGVSGVSTVPTPPAVLHTATGRIVSASNKAKTQ